MADYIYLLENRLSPAQRNALRLVRELARSKNLTVFLVGGAVRDLTSGSPVRDLDVVVQGNAPKLRKELEKLGVTITGELEAGQSLFAAFAGGVRMEIGSTLAVTFPKPGKPVYKPATILYDLRRRDFTANSMALSLNEGSYGLLMDPLNGVADIENRELRLASNYGFIEDPARMIRAARLMARLGWSMDEKTRQRYDTGKQEGYISALSEIQRGYELEEIIHEEDPLRVLRRLESEGWMQVLAPFWSSSKVDVNGLEHLREVQTQLQLQGIHPEASAANFPLLTAKLSAKEVATLTSSFVRQGFVKEIGALESKAKELVTLLSSKSATLPSQSWKILTSAPAEAVLWVAYSSKSPAIQAKFKSFATVWPQARQKMPYVLMQEMRIVPDLPGYDELLEKLFFELMDDKLQTPEEIKAFLEPFSPPAPPPPPNLRRPRAPRKESKGAKSRARKAAAPVEDPDDIEAADVPASLPQEADSEVDHALTEALETTALPSLDDDTDGDDPEADIDADDDDAHAPRAASRTQSKAAAKSLSKPPARVAAPAPTQPAVKSPAKSAPAAPAKSAPAKSAPPKAAPAKAAAPAKSTPAKSALARSAPAKAGSHKTAPQKTSATKAPASNKSTPAKKTSPAPSKSSGPARPKSNGAAKPPAKSAAKKAVPPPKKLAKSAGPAKKSAKAKVPAKRSAPAKSPAKAVAKPPARKTPPTKSASKKAAPAKKSR